MNQRMETRFALSSRRRVGAGVEDDAGVEEEAAARHVCLVKLLELPALLIRSAFL